jgi:hypothetical protein
MVRIGRRGSGLLVLTTTLVLALVVHVPPAAAAEDGPPILVGAGDIADCTTVEDEATATLLDDIPGTVFTLGDNVYQSGTAAEFAACYEPTWGRHRHRTRPSVGNHDYGTAGAKPYYAYFGSAAGPAGRGWYSYDLGAWHIVVLNSNCTIVACTASSPQLTWLRSDLAAHPDKHVLAYFHHPLYSSGKHGPDLRVRAIWEALYAAGTEVVLVGHEHDYERFAPLDPWGRRDDAFGIRQFVVGTGGTSLRTRATNAPHSEVFGTTHGVLKLTLRDDGYDWEFVPIAGMTFSDAGSGTVHVAPPPRTTTTFIASADAWVSQLRPSKNYGTATTLVSDGDIGSGKDAHAYVKVKVSGTSGIVDRAVLRLWVVGGTKNGPKVARTSTSWSGSTITWNTRPKASTAAVADTGKLVAGTWAEFDVTSLVRGNGTYSFVVLPTSSDGLDVSSMQGSRPPRLTVSTVPAD